MNLSKSRWLLGGLMSAVVAAGVAGYARAEEDEKDETKVTFDQLPAPVQATLKSEANGGKIGDIDREDKKKDYEADVVIGGKNYEITVAEDGTLLSKKLEKDDDDEKEDKGK